MDGGQDEQIIDEEAIERHQAWRFKSHILGWRRMRIWGRFA